MKVITIFVLFTFPFFLSAKDSKISSEMMPPTVTEMGVSALVYNCVNAITGDFIDQSLDIELLGPETLTYERFYADSSRARGCLYSGWMPNHNSWIIIGEEKCKVAGGKENCHVARFMEKSGRSSFFLGARMRDTPTYLRFHPELTGKGFSNCSEGIISGRTNLKTYTLIFDKHERNQKLAMKVQTQNGSLYTLDRQEKYDDYYTLIKERKPNGHCLNYKYDDEARLISISSTDATGKRVYNSISINHKPLEELKDGIEFELVANNKEKVKYTLGKFIQKDTDKEFYAITEVIRPHHPKVSYRYLIWRDQPFIFSKSLPNGRDIRIHRYLFEEKVAGHKVKVDDNHAFLNDRICKIEAPFGENNKMIPVCSLIYKPHLKRKKNENEFTIYGNDDIVDGYTKVYDAQNHQTKYYYDESSHLTKIKKYKGKNKNEYSGYSEENFLWGSEDSAKEGYFLGKYVKSNLNNAIYYGRLYEYNDDFGNITKETLYGNIRGNSQAPTWNGSNFENGDHYSVTYEYTKNDVLHLMTSQKEDNGKGAIYTYHPHTDLLASKLITEHGIVRIRNFYEYDSDAVLIKTIVDDGSSEKGKEDLTGVTERHISYMEPTQNIPIGLPRVIREYYYDSGNEVLKKTTENSYSPEGYLIKQVVKGYKPDFSYTTEWNYDSHGLVIWEKNAEGYQISREYDENDNLILEKGPHPERTIVHEYDLANRRISTQITTRKAIYNQGNGLISTTSNESMQTLTSLFCYDTLGNCTSAQDPFGHKTFYTYDDFNRNICIEYPEIQNDKGSLLKNCVQQEYDILGNVTKTTDQQKSVTEKEYNVHGKPTKISYPDGTWELFEYNLDGTLIKSIAPNGTYTKYIYDCFGREKQKDIFDSNHKLLKSSTNKYNSFHLKESTDPSGLTTYYEHDKAGRVISEKRNNRLTTYEYDSLDRVIATKEWYGDSPNAYRAKFQSYNGLNQVVEEYQLDGQTNEKFNHYTYRYDCDGHVTTKISYLFDKNAATHMFYNADKLLQQVIDPLGNQTIILYNYDAINAYNQKVMEVTEIDSFYNKTVTTSNTLGKPALIKKINPAGQVVAKKEIFYNGSEDCICSKEEAICGNEIKRVVTNTWEYDHQHRLKELIEAKGSTKQKITKIIYNNFGQKECVIKPDGNKINYTYDELGRLNKFSGPSFYYIYEYDLNDNPKRILDKILKTVTTRIYEKGILVNEKLGNDLEIIYGYDRLERPIEVIFPDQSSVSYAYDGLHLKSIDRLDPSENILYTHSYTKHHSLSKVSEMKLPGKAGFGTYTYDLIGKCIESKFTHYSETVSYDKRGNIYSVKCNNSENTYKYDDTNQLKSESGDVNHTYVCDSLYNCLVKDGFENSVNEFNQLTQDRNGSYLYDDNGNLRESNKNGEITRYNYDGQDRLIEVCKNNTKYIYVYDAFNRRLQKQKFEKQNAEWKKISTDNYLYQGQNEVGICDPTTKKILELRILGTGMGAEIGANIAIEVNGQTAVPLHDHNGNISTLLELTSGDIIESYRYSAFGEEKILDQNGDSLLTSSFSNPWRFSSKRVDEETGFINFGRRYYDPSTSRWITPDPLGFEAGPNLYAYVLNSPLSHIDLYGLIGNNPQTRNGTPPISLQTIYYGIRSLVSYGMKQLGSLVYMAGRHFVPIPIMDGFVRAIGTLLQGKLPTRETFIDREHSKVDTVGTKELSSGSSIGITTGILNSLDESKGSATTISTAAGGVRVYTGGNATHGTSFDLLEYFGQCWGVITNSIRKTASSLWSRTKKALQYGGECLQFAHSQGGMILYRCLQMKMFSSLQKSLLSVVTFGSAKIIDPMEFGLAYAMNYVCWMDLIPFMGDPIGIAVGLINGCLRGKHHITFVSGLIPFWDHQLLNDPYARPLEQHAKKFANRHMN